MIPQMTAVADLTHIVQDELTLTPDSAVGNHRTACTKECRLRKIAECIAWRHNDFKQRKPKFRSP